MEEDANKDQQSAIQPTSEVAVMAIPEYCIRDGSEMYEGTKFGYPAWICPSCTYWKLKL